jgi:hypothetical protein
MRTYPVLICLLLLAGCDTTPALVATPIIAGVGVGSIPVLGRSPVDAVYSLATNRDCSVVRLDQGKTYCRAIKPAPPPPEFCSRSLGVVDCWADPDALPDHPRGVADGPIALTPAQEANRTRGWP